jgi:hypothetical protein
MQRAEALQALIRKRGKQGKPLERVYRMLFNPELYLVAYAKLYRNDGATTEGARWRNSGVLLSLIDSQLVLQNEH